VASYFVSADEYSRQRDKRLEAAAANARHRVWLKRSADAKEAKSWQPVKFHRTAAAKFIEKLDNQFLHNTAWGGLNFMQWQPNVPKWLPENWRKWPGSTGTIDQGGDGLSACFAMVYLFQCNLWMFFDWCHGGGNDLWVAIKAIGKYEFVLLTLCIMNLPHGPDREEGMRFAQLQESLQSMLDSMHWATFDLFRARADDIIDELGDKLEAKDSREPHEALWCHLQSLVAYPKKDRKVKTGEFMAWQRGGEELLQQWTLCRFRTEHLGLEHGMFTASVAKDKFVVKRSAVELAEAAEGTTDAAITQIDAKVLRGSVSNAVVLSMQVLSHPPYKRVLAILIIPPRPLAKWVGKCAQTMVDSEANHKWLVDQHRGGFMGHQFQMLATLLDPEFLKVAGFFAFQSMDADDREGQMFEDEVFAKMAGEYTMSLLAARHRRIMYVQEGWPNLYTRAHVSAEEAVVITKEFQEAPLISTEAFCSNAVCFVCCKLAPNGAQCKPQSEYGRAHGSKSGAYRAPHWQVMNPVWAPNGSLVGLSWTEALALRGSIVGPSGPAVGPLWTHLVCNMGPNIDTTLAHVGPKSATH
jgi:hypothetical protein